MLLDLIIKELTTNSTACRHKKTLIMLPSYAFEMQNIKHGNHRQHYACVCWNIWLKYRVTYEDLFLFSQIYFVFRLKLVKPEIKL